MKRFLPIISGALLCMAGSVQVSAQNVYTQLTNLGTLYIQTTSGADPMDKQTYLPCTITMVENGSQTTYTITSGGIRGRGNSTWSANKKPWRLKFDSKVALLGKEFAKEKSWTLLANAYDKSLMRNALTYHIGKFMGMEFCPAAKHVDLVLNGVYRGTYQISDQMEVKAKRVPVDTKTGWLLEYANAEDKVDDPKVALNWNGTYYGNVEIKNPEFDDDNLATNPTLANAISDYLNKTVGPKIAPETTGYNYVDAVKGYRAGVDTLSLINWYIATELTANWDGFYSIYSYREGTDAEDTRLHMGPMWDYDLAYGNHTETYDYFSDFYQKLLADCNFNRYQFPGGYRKMQPVVRHLWDDPWFANAVTQRLHKLLAEGIQSHLEGKIDAMKTEMAASAKKNFETWSISNDDRGYSTAENRVSWDQSVSLLRKFIGTRLAMMKTQFERLNKNNIYLDEQVDNAASLNTSKTGVNVVLRRKAAANEWNTVCLPFDLDATCVAYYFGEGARVAEFASTSTTNGTTLLNFTSTSTIKAGVPCLVMPTRTVDTPFSFLSLSLGTSAQTIEKNGCQMVGTYAPTSLTADATVRRFDNGVASQPSDATTALTGYSAYFVVPASLATAPVVVTVDNQATAIHTISTHPDKTTDKAYNLNGQALQGSLSDQPHGVYIYKGVKVVK